MKIFKSILQVFLIFLLFFVYTTVYASEITVFGPKEYLRTTGAPDIYTNTFNAQLGEALLVIRNGKAKEDKGKNSRVRSGVISLNGIELFSHDDFKHQTYILERPVNLQESNSLRVELEGKPGTLIYIDIIQTIDDPLIDILASDPHIDSSNCPEYIDISLQLTNTGEAEIPAGVHVAFYNGDPQKGGILVGTTTSTESLSQSDYEDITFRWVNPSVEEAILYAQVDDDGTGTGAYEEVDEANNLISAQASFCQVRLPGNSSLSGQAIDAVNGNLLSGVQTVLHVDDNGTPGAVVASLETDSQGAFLFTDLAAGSYIIAATYSGYIEAQRAVTVDDNVQLMNQDLVLSPLLNEEEIRIILTWDSRPADLEAHLTVANQNGCRYHCYYWNKNIPTANLDLDDRDGYGPETITIKERASGTLRYYVHDFTNRYSNSRWLALSKAEVKVYSGNREPLVFTVPNSYGNVWHVFDLDGDTGEIIPVHIMSLQSEPGRIDYPTFTSQPPRHAYWNTPYIYQVGASDPDNDTLSFSLQQSPEGMTIDPDTGLIEWTPMGNQSGWYNVIVKIDDGRCGETTQSFNVYVYSQPTVQFTVEPCSGYNPGGNITLNWSTTRATTVLIDQGIGEVPASGTLTIGSPDVPSLYTLTAFNDAALTKRTVPAVPSAYFYFYPNSIYLGQSTTLYWNPKCAVESIIDHDIGSVTSAGSMVLSPSETTTYNLMVTNAALTRNYRATVHVVEPPVPKPNGAISISPKCNLTPGEPLKLSWWTTNATYITISPDIGEVEPGEGSMLVYPMEAGSYTLSATGKGGSITRTVKFPGYPSLSFYALPSHGIDLGDSVRLNWSVECADTVTMNQGIGELEASSSLAVTPESLPITYALTASNERAAVFRSITLYQIPPEGTFTAEPAILKVGDSSTLTWTSTRATSCTITPDIGPVALNGSITVTPGKPTYYTLTMVGPGGTYRRHVSVGFVHPMADLKASSMSINEGESVQLSWIFANSTSCVIDQGIGEVELGGELTVTPNATTTYTMTATGPGGTATDQVTINVIPGNPPPAVSLATRETVIIRGDSTVLSWESAYTDTLTIEPGPGSVAVTGTKAISPEVTTTYTATAIGPGGTTTAMVTITVVQPSPGITLQTEPTSIMAGESTVLSWTSSNAERIIFNQGIGEGSLQGSLTISPNTTTTFIATATGPGGTTTKSVTVTVSHPVPTVSISASPETIQAGEFSTLSWSCTNADACEIDHGIGSVDVIDSTTVSPTETTTYTITAAGAGGTAESSITVTVVSPIILNITSPLNGDTISRPDTMIKGLLTNTEGHETGVVVNGVSAVVYGNQFVANHVPVEEGLNTLTATAADTEGNTATASIDVNAVTTGDYIRITADTELGVSPLETVLRVDGSFSFTESLLSHTGPAPVEFLQSTAEEYRLQMTAEGIYYFTAEVTDTQNNTYTDTIAVVVLNKDQMDALLKAKWNGMKAKLLKGDIEGALDYFSSLSRGEYKEIFTVLSKDLEAIASGMEDIGVIYIKEDVAKYRIRKDEIINGESHRITYYIYFVKGPYGFWYIDSF